MKYDPGLPSAGAALALRNPGDLNVICNVGFPRSPYF